MYGSFRGASVEHHYKMEIACDTHTHENKTHQVKLKTHSPLTRFKSLLKMNMSGIIHMQGFLGYTNSLHLFLVNLPAYHKKPNNKYKATR